MSKKLIAIMVLAFVVGITAAAFAEVQNVKVGGDITAVGLIRDNLNFQRGGNPNSELSAKNEFATISRIKIDANLTDNVDVTFRLLNERVWGGTAGTDSATSNAQVDVDLAYVTFKEFMKSNINVPLNLVIGRQDIKIGSGLVVGCAGTNQSNTTQLPTGAGDFSVRSAFDAIVGVWDFTPEFTVITGFIKVAEGSVTVGHDTDAYIADATYKLGDNAMNTAVEGTYVIAHVNRASVNNYGARITTMPIKDLNLEGEYVLQTQNTSTSVVALAGEPNLRGKYSDAIRLNAMYTFPDVAWKPGFGVDYMRLSNHWYKMLESMSPADLANLIFDNTDLTVVGATATAKPMNDLMLKARYANLATTKRIEGTGIVNESSSALGTYQMNSGKKALGYEVDLGLAYDYTSDVQFGLGYGWLTPGKAFVGQKTATQVMGSMKVSF
jgi:hypothetical protein